MVFKYIKIGNKEIYTTDLNSLIEICIIENRVI